MIIKCTDTKVACNEQVFLIGFPDINDAVDRREEEGIRTYLFFVLGSFISCKERNSTLNLDKLM